MDEVIFEEFKGTGKRRAAPGIAAWWIAARIRRSTSTPPAPPRRAAARSEGTRAVFRLRRVLSDMNPVESVELP